MEEKKYIGKIAAVSTKNKANGSIGFLIEGIDSWFNINTSESALDTLLKVTIIKGNKIEFLMGQTGIEELKVLEAAKVQDKSFSDDMTNYGDLLDAASKKAEKDGMYLSMISKPQLDENGRPMVDFEKKTALYEATLMLREKTSGNIVQTIVDTGDAEGITSDVIKKHFNRMASTRAMARCYRIYTNNAFVAEEETDQ